ncbi:hypothetical protein [Sutcliffiella rhizosphaerae]|uniref:Uncharacterized protein n=1 Tax=Sutcliffiella rhizosphaerae TaxID=2880967 RepID=A0ABM8YKY3_9BACI|nr:hypothetical protein [Sutcliffiella rhizosphaerae]CAG9620602.1 hypothetical protein BACCIP111883_01371 [Sutcliffiella rhizosphaerae]
MELLNISYLKKGQLLGFFDKFPSSKVLFSPIKNYYFVSYVYWDERDAVVTEEDLERMEMLMNTYLGKESFYRKRKNLNEKDAPA